MAESFELEIVTPDRLVVKDRAEEMQIPSKNGYIGILAGHAPLITELSVGEVSYRTGTQTERLAVAWGFAEVLPDRVTILAETAERAKDIDVHRSEEAKKRAEDQLKGAESEVDFDRALSSLRRADLRLKVASEGESPAHH